MYYTLSKVADRKITTNATNRFKSQKTFIDIRNSGWKRKAMTK